MSGKYRSGIMLWIPFGMVVIYVLISGVGLRWLGLYSVLPFDRWDMYSVPSAAPSVYYEAIVRDAEGKVICSIPGCKGIYPPDRQAQVVWALAHMGAFYEKHEASAFARWKKLFFREVRSGAGLSFTLLKKERDFSIPSGSEGIPVIEFADDPP